MDTQTIAPPSAPTQPLPLRWAALTLTVGDSQFPMSVGFRVVDVRIDLNAGWFATARNSVRPDPFWETRRETEIVAVQVGSGQNVLPLLSREVKAAIRKVLKAREGIAR